MEVHHHPDLHHRRKKFKEYFLEFLMIFLAVTLGFLAESLRENMSDKEKEKGYIGSLINNIQDDTASIRNIIGENQQKLDSLKKLMTLTRGNLPDLVSRQAMYRYASQAVGYYSVFESNDATMMQLKNSGGLRFIRKGHVADSIAEYDNQMKGITGAGLLYLKGTDAALLATHEVLDYTIYFDPAYLENGQLSTHVLPPLLTEDRRSIHIMFNKIEFEIGATANYLNNLRERIPFMVRMITYLRKEYDLT
jgi:Clavanin